MRNTYIVVVYTMCHMVTIEIFSQKLIQSSASEYKFSSIKRRLLDALKWKKGDCVELYLSDNFKKPEDKRPSISFLCAIKTKAKKRHHTEWVRTLISAKAGQSEYPLTLRTIPSACIKGAKWVSGKNVYLICVELPEVNLLVMSQNKKALENYPIFGGDRWSNENDKAAAKIESYRRRKHLVNLSSPEKQKSCIKKLNRYSTKHVGGILAYSKKLSDYDIQVIMKELNKEIKKRKEAKKTTVNEKAGMEIIK
jgi:hypothetical protein